MLPTGVVTTGNAHSMACTTACGTPSLAYDGSAKTLADVVDHYNGVRKLALTDQQKRDLVEYLKTL